MYDDTPRRVDPTPPERRRSDIHAHRRRARGRSGRRRLSWYHWGLAAIASVLVVSVGLFGLAYLKLNGNINRIDIAASLGDRPEASEGPLNILVMGSDTRQGIGTTEFGTSTIEGGAHSDTNLLVHLSADRTWITVVSIPRDSMTMAPADCADPTSTVANGVMRQWNYNYHLGGPACTIKTLEGLTDIFIDHFVVVDFRGFQEMVDALGGVEVCTPVPINDPASGLVLPAGRSVVDGETALGYVRARKTLGNGSDLGRIKRQQAFLSSVVQQATSSELLLRPDRLYGFLDAATQSITADQNLSVGTMKDIAESIKDIGMANIQFVTVPVEVYPPDPNRVQWTSAADVLWEHLRNDVPLPGSPRAKELAAQKGADEGTEDDGSGDEQHTDTVTAADLIVSPAAVAVEVINDAGIKGLAHQNAAALEVQGFTITRARDGNFGSTQGIVVKHGPGKADSAETVAAAYPDAEVILDPSLGDVVHVHVGEGAQDVVEAPNRVGTQPLPPQPISAGEPVESEEPGDQGEEPVIEARSATDDICQTT